MKKSFKPLLAVAAAGAIALGGAGTASAVTEYVGGGTWDHYITFNTNTSNYYHGNLTHSSTARNGVGGSVTSGRIAKGKWAYATVQASLSGNTAYWNTY
jgi:lactococcin 972 family bacteriocin